MQNLLFQLQSFSTVYDDQSASLPFISNKQQNINMQLQDQKTAFLKNINFLISMQVYLHLTLLILKP